MAMKKPHKTKEGKHKKGYVGMSFEDDVFNKIVSESKKLGLTCSQYSRMKLILAMKE